MKNQLILLFFLLLLFQQTTSGIDNATNIFAPSTSDIARMARNPVGLLNSLADRATAADEEATNAAAAAAHEAPVGAGSPEGESEPQPEILVEPDSIVDLPPRASQVIPPRRATTDVATAPPDASLN